MSRPSYPNAMDEAVRLTILKELAAQGDGRCNSTMLGEALFACGFNKSPEYLASQLYFLLDKHAVVLSHHGSVVIAEITKLGIKHVLRQDFIAGVREPRPGV